MRHDTIIGIAVSLATNMLAASPAAAASREPLSLLPSMPRAAKVKKHAQGHPVAGLTVASTDIHKGQRWHDLRASTGRGYCLSTRDLTHRWVAEYGTGTGGTSPAPDLNRLVERDGKATFESTKLHIDPSSGEVSAVSRATVELREVGRAADGFIVWAFRDGADVILLARGIGRGTESVRLGPDDQDVSSVSVDRCPFAGARISPDRGSIAQLFGDLPARGEGKDKTVPHFIVDASLSRVSRDPEPVLSVRVRTIDEAALP